MPKIIDHDQRRRDIIEVAKRLILQGGFEAATMRSIAAEAGFANGALKHYFPGKESIIAATFESVLAEMDPRGALKGNDPAPGQDPESRLRDSVNTGLPFTDAEINAGRVLLVLWEHAASNPELAELYRQFFARWREMTTRLIADASEAAGKKGETDYDVLSLEILTATIGANVVNLMHPDRQHVETYRTFTEKFINRVVGRT
ncbi:TetR/AcrR family transcriptional regulator [Cucumibacter marinus]|uniref:TetR/AcrR family transcriptional regulator n=1 Tax=Cucumibacter marinus TaxID=1121252 RepID=UPI00041D98A4|nr:TetR/AcrR family transcriptional regulator [Cucumibacter marinus]